MKNNWTQSDSVNSIFCNCTDSVHSDDLKQAEECKIIFVSILGILFIVSLTGNIFTCYVIVTRHLLKNTVWIYLFILSITDGSMTLTSTPLAILGTFYEHLLCITWLCELSVSSQVLIGTFSIYTVVAISIYKLNHVSKPLASLAQNGIRSFTCYVVLTSIIAFGIVLPPVFGFSGFVHFPGRKWCSIWSEEQIIQSKIMLTAILALGYVIPFIIIISTSVRTYVVFRKHNTRMKNVRRSKSHKVIAKNRTMLRTLFLVVALFICLWTPLAMYTLFKAVGVKMPLKISHLAFIIMFSQGCVNPIIYCFKHHAFNKVIRNIVRGRKASLRRKDMVRRTDFHETSSVDEDVSENKYQAVSSTKSKDRELKLPRNRGRRTDDIVLNIMSSTSEGMSKTKEVREPIISISHTNPYYITHSIAEKEGKGWIEPHKTTAV